MTTPFIAPLAVSGGTFYTSVSAATDISMTFNNSGLKFQFSKFCLLNIPPIGVPAFNNNLIQFQAIQGQLPFGYNPPSGISGDPNFDLANSFENYYCNLEAGVLSQASYDFTVKHSVAERCFFKWLKELGVIQFQPAGPTQNALNQTTSPRWVELPESVWYSPTTGDRYTSQNTGYYMNITTGATGQTLPLDAVLQNGPNQYNRVVQYLGNIDIVNNVQNNVNAYSEIYIYVPTNSGNTPLILFQTAQDANYFPGMIVQNTPQNPDNNGIIFGRNWYDTQPAGLSIQAVYDQLVYGAVTSYILPDLITPQNWFGSFTEPNSYFTDQSFTDSTTDQIRLSCLVDSITTTINYERSRLDGIGIDFQPTDYFPIVSNPNLSTFDQFNQYVDAGPFDFNCILLYYDLYDPNNVLDTQTNLYGVLFLEDMQQDGSEFSIPVFSKYIPNVVTGLNGNSYGFKQNVLFDTSLDNSGVVAAINDYSSFSLSMFMDAMNQLTAAVDIITTSSETMNQINNTVIGLQNQILNQTQLAQLDQAITELQDSFATNQALFTNTSAIMDLINSNANALNSIIKGESNITISYSLDAIKAGNGINVDTSVPNQITISSTVEPYTVVTTNYQADISGGVTIAMQPYANYYRHYASGLVHTLNGDLIVQLNDTINQWQAGQSFRLSFQDPIILGANNLIILTDAPGRLGNGTYGILVGVVPGSAFATANGTPMMDIICTDSVNLIFVLDCWTNITGS